MSEARSYRVGQVTMIPVGGRWHYRFQLDPFPRQQKSTKEPLRNRARAEQAALDAWEAAKLRARGEEPEPTLGEAFSFFVDEPLHVLRMSASHLANIERCGRLHLGDLAELKLTQLSTKAVEVQLGVFLQDHAVSTSNQWLTYVRIVCKWAIRRRMIRAMPFDVPEATVKRKAKPLLPTGKVMDWLAAVDRKALREPSLAVILRLQVGLGLRPSEARWARWEWMDWERATYTPSETKGGDAVARPVPPWLMAYLQERRQPFGWMVPTRRGGKVSAFRLGAVVEAACKAVKIPRLTPHRLRATYATWLSEDGATIQDIQHVLEHKDINTTAGYLGIDLTRVRTAQERGARRTGLAGRGSGEASAAKAQGDAK
jgi:integrase